MNDNLDSTARQVPAVHHYESSVEAYGACQGSDVHDGDVLLVEPESLVGVLVGAWPVAVTTGACGQFHRLERALRTIDGGRYAASADVAEALATGLELPVDERRVEAFDGQPATGPFIVNALTAEGIEFEVADTYLRVPTPSGEILISAVHCDHCNDPLRKEGAHDGTHPADALGLVATWYDKVTPNGWNAEVYDGCEARLQPIEDAEACAFAVRAFLSSDGGHLRRLLRAALDTSRPVAASRAKSKLRRIVGNGLPWARKRQSQGDAPF